MQHATKTFSPTDIAKSMAIVKTFETGKPSGDYAAFAVLNDGAGVSYGISQFTHRSGSLKEVLENYLANGGNVGRREIEEELPLLRVQNVHAIRLTASNATFKKALIAAATTSEMKAAQHHVLFERYMRPAIAACEGSGFTLPLSLAVIYDSMTHGSYHLIRDRVRLTRSGLIAAAFEKAWITEYVLKRDAWLNAIPRLRSTRYRMRFFLDQIAVGRWQLELPLRVNGTAITQQIITELSAAEPYKLRTLQPQEDKPQTSANQPATIPQARQPIEIDAESGKLFSMPRLEQIEQYVDRVAARYDRIERIALTAVNRSDRAKSLWTTVAGTIWQTAWAVFGIAAGMPREVWLVVAVIAAALMFGYLYRQITLGRIREAETASFSKEVNN